MNASEVNRLLIEAYGDRPWHPHHAPLSELIAVILSQNTSDTNSQRAFDSLLHTFGNWEDVSRADVKQIEQTIQVFNIESLNVQLSLPDCGLTASDLIEEE